MSKRTDFRFPADRSPCVLFLTLLCDAFPARGSSLPAFLAATIQGRTEAKTILRVGFGQLGNGSLNSIDNLLANAEEITFREGIAFGCTLLEV